MSAEDTRTDADGSVLNQTTLRTSRPGLLVAFAPAGAASVDRLSIDSSVVVGRQVGVGFQVDEHTVSREHFKVSVGADGAWLEDLGSSNGTMVDGCRVEGRTRLPDGALIRAGQCLFVFHENVVPLLNPPLERYGMVGPFHVGPILGKLRKAAHSYRSCLLYGPSGVGKELAANAFAQLALEGTKGGPTVTHNCALFGTEDQAVSGLFGVAARTFTGVGQLDGLVEKAESGVLFLDEVHALPERVQRALLRLFEDGTYLRIGDPTPRRLKAKIVLATNVPPPDHGLLHDLLARLIVVSLPNLAERKADLPALLIHHLDLAFERLQLGPELMPRLTASLCETLCLDGLKKFNVRALIDIADHVAAAAADGEDSSSALLEAVGATVRRNVDDLLYMNPEPEEPGVKTTIKEYLRYEDHRQLIEKVLREVSGNVAQAKRILQDQHHLVTSRKTLARYVELWGVRR